MPALDNESQFRFLIACIRHSSAGKVDFEEVRKECDIVSKGAAAKRYERLMKAHGIGTNGVANGVKKEAKDSDNTKKAKPRAKKRKLNEVDEDEDDVDEPVKTERGIKGEFKTEDALVKSECSNEAIPRASPLHHLPSHPEPTSSSTNPVTDDDDDDDEVLFVSATEKQCIPSTPTFAIEHRQSQAHSPMPAIPGIHSVDYATNMSFPQHLAAPQPSPMTMMETMNPPSSFSYGFAPGTWVFPHESHDYL
ncbi:hypothetical protein F5Y03DRAFT_391629 [Xylaria venustula]|nr:hypothetical protein F5Y03DRAFT_391629 [Xylaria venustula]